MIEYVFVHRGNLKVPCKIVKSLDEFRVRPNLNRIIFKQPLKVPTSELVAALIRKKVAELQKTGDSNKPTEIISEAMERSMSEYLDEVEERVRPRKLLDS